MLPILNQVARRILAFDCGAACVAGLVVVSLHKWLATVYGLPQELVRAMGVVNLLYACYSGSLAWRVNHRGNVSRSAVEVLVTGNFGWTLICGAIIVLHFSGLNPLGVALVSGEALFVGALAAVEARFVRAQATRQPG